MGERAQKLGRDSLLHHAQPEYFKVAGGKKTAVNKTISIKADKIVTQIIFARENVEAGLNKKVADVFAKAFKAKKLLSAKELIAKGYKMENLAGVKNFKLTTLLDKKGIIKKEGELLIKYIHSFVSEGFEVVIGKHLRSTAKTEKLAVYIKK